MNVNLRYLWVFFVLVSFLYASSPIISASMFEFRPDGLLLFSLVAFGLITMASIGFLAFNQNIYIEKLNILPLLSFMVGLLLFATLISVLLAVYGDLKSAIFQSYMSRTGMQLPGLISVFYYPLLACTSAYISLVVSDWLFFETVGFYRYGNLLIAILFLLIFLASGNRNFILWSLSLPIALYIGTSNYPKIILLVSAMVFLSVIVAAFRNFGLENLADFVFPEYEYWNPIVHEYGTTYRVYDLIVNKNSRVDGYTIYGQSYLDGFINILPSFFKPDGFSSFSDSISMQYAENGEGLGNSPVAETIFNGYFPAIIVQVIPLYLLIFVAKIRRNYRRLDFIAVLRYPAIAGLIIATFNFWRIGNSELIKILVSFTVGFVLVAVVVVDRSSKSRSI